MLRSLEIVLIQFSQWYLGQSWLWSLMILGPIAAICILTQFQRYKETYLYGFAFLILSWIVFLHGWRTEGTIQRLDAYISSIEDYRSSLTDAGPFEPLLDLFVGPVESRSPVEETIFYLILMYLISVPYQAIKDQRRTGAVVAKNSFSIFGKGKLRRPRRSETNELGSGNFATAEAISRWLKPSGKVGDTMLYMTGIKGDGGIIYEEAKCFIPATERNRHMLVIAKTGSGKTTKLILPILYNDCLDKTRSTIVIDAKPEMWAKLAAMTRKHNPEKQILLFNPLDTLRSLSWNILGKIENDTDAKLIANSIIAATDNPNAKSDSPFFRNNALAVLNAIMQGLLHDANETLSMPRIHELVQSGMKSLCDWLEAHPEAIRSSRTFVELARSGSQNADTIMSELSMRLSAWDIKAIRATTAFSELDVDSIVEKPTLFIVELRESELEMLRPLANVIVVELLRFLTKKAEAYPGCTLPRPVGLVIDEFASAIGRLPDIHVKLNTLRSRNVSIVAAIQSLGQIKANYGDNADSVTAGFSTKILIPNLEFSDSEWASKESGQMTIRFKTQTVGSNRKLIEVFASRNDSTQEQLQQRAVLTPDEIGRPADNISTFFLPDTAVFQGFLTPYYKIPEMGKRIAEFDSLEKELKLRDRPIDFIDSVPVTAGGAAVGGGYGGVAGGVGGAYNANPPGITDTTGMTDDQIWDKIDKSREKLDWANTTGTARKWWQAFERENKTKPALVLRLCEELTNRAATITEFFLAYVYSNTDNIQANLNYLDYLRLKKEEEKKKREQDEASGKSTTEPPLSYDDKPFTANY